MPVARLWRLPRSIAAAESVRLAPPGGRQFFLAGGPYGLSEPARDPRHRFAHVLGRTRVGKADEPAAVDRVEVDAGRCRDMGLLQHSLREFVTVLGEGGNVGIEIELSLIH